jgi:MFS family permease
VSLVALSHRNFRLLWLGEMISLAGSMMQTAAILWHVSLLVEPANRGLALGMVGLVRVGPVVAFSLISGVAADALDRRRLMMVTQSASMTIAFVLAVLTLSGLSVVWPIYALAALASSVSSFDLPARQALTPSLVPREHLANALSLNQITFQAAAVAGPALGGFVIATAGVGWAYLFNAASFLCVLIALALMRGVPRVQAHERATLSIAAGLEGLRFVFSTAIIRSTMLLDFVATLFASATALLPIYAQDILDIGPSGYGWLYAAPAVGSFLTSALMVRTIEHIRRRGPMLLWSVALYGVATILFGVSRQFWMSFACLAVTGAADTVSTVLRGVIRQLETPDRLRGRMTGVNMVFFLGGPQLGELEAGLVAHWWTAPVSVVSGGIGTILATGLIAARTPQLRRYRRGELEPAAAANSTDVSRFASRSAGPS